MTNRTIIVLPGALYHWVFFQYIYTPVTWCTVTELPSKTFTLLLPGVLYYWVFIRYIYTPVTWCTVPLGFHHIHLHSCYLVHCITEFSSDTLTLLLPGTLSLGFLPIHLHVHSCYQVHCHWAFFPKTFTLMLPGVLYHWVFSRYITLLLPGALYHRVFITYITLLLPGVLYHWVFITYIYTQFTWCTVTELSSKHLHSCYMVHCVTGFSLNPLIAVSPCGLCNWVFIWCNSQSFYLLSTRFSPDPFSHFSW